MASLRTNSADSGDPLLFFSALVFVLLYLDTSSYPLLPQPRVGKPEQSLITIRAMLSNVLNHPMHRIVESCGGRLCGNVKSGRNY
jgi:hypothetical protein